MTTWLQQFDLKAEVSRIIFAVAIVVTTLITLTTISYHTIKAALMNPVNALKRE